MKPMSTLSEILTLAGSQFNVYDMGRCISPIEIQDFYALETGQIPYPAPINGHGRFALCFWAINAPEAPYIWFIQFPVDELGFLKLSCRDQFLDLVIKALGKDLKGTPEEQAAKALASNPYIFKPLDDKKAYFNARLKRDLILSPSQYYAPVQAYFQGRSDWSQWQNLALQGLADFVCRLDQSDNDKALLQALPYLPQEVLVNLCPLLEHQAIDTFMTQALLKLARQYTDPQLKILLLRATASSSSAELRQDAISDCIRQATSEQLLIAIAGRLWKDLTSTKIRSLFFESLANQSDTLLFNQLFADLSAIPMLREEVLNLLQEEPSSPMLTQSIAELVQSTRG